MHVIVIGAGPAGSLVALLLARDGAAVTLVEQSAFPRDKVCGECVSATGLSVLGRHGLAEAFTSVGVPLTHTRLVGHDQTTLLELPASMLGITRLKMDVMMLDFARAAGVKILQPARAEAIEANWVRVRHLSDNTISDLPADMIIVADGRGAVANASPAERPPATGDLGIKTHFMGVDAPSNAITLYSTADCYGGVAPVEGGLWNAAFSIPAARVKRHGGNIESAFEEVTQANPTLRNEFTDARRIGRWLAAPLPRYPLRRDWPANVVPVGNAACAIEPIGGEGMGMALASAELAAAAILHGHTAKLADQYEALWHRRPWSCRAGAVVLSNPTFADACIAAAAVPIFARVGMMMIGK